MELTEILKTLPHRYPLLLVDRVLEVEAKKRIVAIKNVTFNEAFFQGHFPGMPVMPGVLILEAMAQAGAILLLHEMPDRENKVVMFGGIDRARFRRPVVPGDRLVLKVECLRHRSRSSKMRGVAEVDGERVAEAEVLCAYGDRESI